jgi:hypothetical protein
MFDWIKREQDTTVAYMLESKINRIKELSVQIDSTYNMIDFKNKDAIAKELLYYEAIVMDKEWNTYAVLYDQDLNLLTPRFTNNNSKKYNKNDEVFHSVNDPKLRDIIHTHPEGRYRIAYFETYLDIYFKKIPSSTENYYVLIVGQLSDDITSYKLGYAYASVVFTFLIIFLTYIQLLFLQFNCSKK